MDCEQVMKEDIAEKYLLGQLSEADQDAFEQHYFECAWCFEEVEAYSALHGELQRPAPAIRAERVAQGVPWCWACVGAVAVALVAVGLGWWRRYAGPHVQPPPPMAVAPSPRVRVQPEPAAPQPTAAPSSAPSLAELAQLQPPVYTPLVVRGPVDEATERFRRAMVHYTKKDYEAAIPGLRAATQLDPEAVNAHFFLAICYLLTARTDPAIQGLQKTIALGESPFLEEAQFYLAKAYLQKGDLKAAERELKTTTELRGEREGEARELLRQVQTISKTPR